MGMESSLREDMSQLPMKIEDRFVSTITQRRRKKWRFSVCPPSRPLETPGDQVSVHLAAILVLKAICGLSEALRGPFRRVSSPVRRS